MKKDIRIIGLDLDGTVFNSNTEIAPRTLRALQSALDAGIHVLPATGRQLSGLPHEFTSLPGVRYALTVNGARIVDLTTGETLHSDSFTLETALSILDDCHNFDGIVHTCIHNDAYMEAPDYSVLEGQYPAPMVEYMRKTRLPVPDLRPFILQSKHPVDKFSMIFPSIEERERAYKHFLSRTDCTTTSSMPFNIEINTSTANKGSGLLMLAEKLGYTAGQVMAMGDGTNDIPMLRAAGHGVAMGNASPQVKAAAASVTLSNDDDGVALAIEAILPPVL